MRWTPSRPERARPRREPRPREPFPCGRAARRWSAACRPASLATLLLACGAFLSAGCGAKAPPEAASPSLTEATATLARVEENGIVDSDVLALRMVLEQVATTLPSSDEPVLQLFDELVEAGTRAAGSRPAIVKQKAAKLRTILSTLPAATPPPGT